MMQYRVKRRAYCSKQNVFLKLIFQYDGPLFQFLDCGIHRQIPVLTGVQKGTHWRLRSSHILLKRCSFEALFLP